MQKIILLFSLITTSMIIAGDTRSPIEITKTAPASPQSFFNPLLSRSNDRRFPPFNSSTGILIPSESSSPTIPSQRSVCTLSPTQQYMCAFTGSMLFIFAIVAATTITCHRYCKN